MKELLKKENVHEGTVILADFQTAGRGRGKNRWSAEPGKNLLFSLLIKPELKASLHFQLNEFISLAIVDTLSEYSVSAAIKWPNDIYAEGKKLAGLLIENVLLGDLIRQSIVGLGLNLNQEQFPKDLSQAISVFQITGKRIAPKEFLEIFLKKISGYYEQLLAGESDALHSRYLTHVYMLGKKITYSSGSQYSQGILKDILPQGEIVVHTNLGSETFHYGEVQLKI